MRNCLVCKKPFGSGCFRVYDQYHEPHGIICPECMAAIESELAHDALEAGRIVVTGRWARSAERSA